MNESQAREPRGAMKILAKTLLFTVLVPGTVAVALPYSFLPSGAGVRWGGFGFLGVVLVALGAAFYLGCAWEFAFAGHGTPAPIDAPRRLVTSGLYRRVRNPMYLGVLLILFGESVLLRSPAILRYALLVGLLFHLFVVYYEEPALKGKFGAAYQDYCKTVRRWIPNLTGTKKD